MKEKYRRYLEKCFQLDMTPLDYNEWIIYESEREYR
jgi:hypothetical protein